MGAMLGFIALNFLPKYDLHYEQLFSYQPSLFKFLLLPTIVFAGSYRADARALFLEAGQAISFGIFGTIISILVIGYGVQWADDVYGPLLYRKLKLTEAFMLASVLSALNPIPLLGAFKSLGVGKRLVTLVYGESMLNAPVAILRCLATQRATRAVQLARLTVLALSASAGWRAQTHRALSCL
jgi:NhaP-type Na+/H+ or K+/H+ antiporter